jgi:starvation-inducible DNA-binding protein
MPKTNDLTNVADALNIVLANSFALYLKTKNFHWHVSGPHFRDYHLLLDEQATQILLSTDLIAERVRKIGGTTLRSIGHIGRLSEIRGNDAEKVGAQAMLKELRADNQTLIAALKKAKELADAAKDNASSGVIDQWTDEAEQRAWFLLEALD